MPRIRSAAPLPREPIPETGCRRRGQVAPLRTLALCSQPTSGRRAHRHRQVRREGAPRRDQNIVWQREGEGGGGSAAARGAARPQGARKHKHKQLQKSVPSRPPWFRVRLLGPRRRRSVARVSSSGFAAYPRQRWAPGAARAPEPGPVHPGRSRRLKSGPRVPPPFPALSRRAGSAASRRQRRIRPTHRSTARAARVGTGRQAGRQARGARRRTGLERASAARYTFKRLALGPAASPRDSDTALTSNPRNHSPKAAPRRHEGARGARTPGEDVANVRTRRVGRRSKVGVVGGAARLATQRTHLG